jgi:hypothetical protein
MRMILAVVGAMITTTQASAAVITRDFELTASTFVNFLSEPAPFTSLSATFRLTYDDTVGGFQGAPVNFSAVTDGMTNVGPFSATPIFGYFPEDAILPFPRLVLAGAVNGGNVMLSGTNDFVFSFDASATGPTAALLSFSVPDKLPFVAVGAVVTPIQATAAVPEPASWALMVGGFGLIGGAMRRRSPTGIRVA